MMVGRARVILRRGKQDEWIASNPVLGKDEPGIVTDTRSVYIGDGETAWLDLLPATGDEALELLCRSVR